MSKRVAFLFPGQGSQTVGMGRELAERFPVAAQTFTEADEACGFPLSKLCFEGPEEDLKLTENTQPAILTVSVAVLRVLAAHGLEPALAAGHSLGEWSAHVAAGTLQFADAVRRSRPAGGRCSRRFPRGRVPWRRSSRLIRHRWPKHATEAAKRDRADCCRCKSEFTHPDRNLGCEGSGGESCRRYARNEAHDAR